MCPAEGQTRLFEVIRTAAEVRETDRAGVWASFGQPYACLGQPQQVRCVRFVCHSSMCCGTLRAPALYVSSEQQLYSGALSPLDPLAVLQLLDPQLQACNQQQGR